MVKLKPLDKVIKSHYRRCCALCKGALQTEVISGGRKRRITQARTFKCTVCPASYCYERIGSHFKISDFYYSIDKYEIHCYYDEPSGRLPGYKIIYDPEPDKSYVDNEIIAESNKPIPFPSTKEKIEDRLYTYITFS
jgi:hypothetical protein